MREETRRLLLQVNRRFYARYSGSFSATRQSPWPGWGRLLPHLQGLSDSAQVLDVGCGNGRFARFLATHFGEAHRYLGIDSDLGLLARASAASDSLRERWLATEISSWLEGTLPCEFDLVVLFGVLHHVPGETHRRRLLSALAGRLAPGGILAVTLWKPPAGSGLDRKTCPWSLVPEIDERDLEPGDRLLAWKGSCSPPRYCHFPTEEELDRCVDLETADLLDQFRSDGRSGEDNLYRVYRRRTPTP